MDLRSKDAIESSKQHDIDMSNILIAEFMGVKTITIGRLKSILRQNRENGFIHTPQAYIVDELKYHTSWDWLMPVLKKINLQLNPDNYNEWRMINKPTEYDIENVHAQAVEFIKNQND